MLNAAKYAKMLAKYAPQSIVCPHCGMQTAISNNSYSFCNFCEQRIDLGKSAPEHERRAQASFAPIASLLKANKPDEAVAEAGKLLKGNTDPEQLYLLGVFYSGASWSKYANRDYGLHGFMEANAVSVRNSLELTSKAKECFYKVIKLVGGAQAGNAAADAQLLFIKFMSCVRLRRKTDAMRALEELKQMDRQNALVGYAYAVYAVETGARDTDKVLGGMLEINEINSFYYLARHLALQKRMGEAALLLRKLGDIATLSQASELLEKVCSAQEASEL